MTRDRMDEDTTDYGRSDEVMEFHGTIITTTPKAIRFTADQWSEPAWIPKSQAEIIDLDETSQRATLHIKMWLCKKNGWSEI